jgi:hypothetical protein
MRHYFFLRGAVLQVGRRDGQTTAFVPYFNRSTKKTKSMSLWVLMGHRIAKKVCVRSTIRPRQLAPQQPNDGIAFEQIRNCSYFAERPRCRQTSFSGIAEITFLIDWNIFAASVDQGIGKTRPKLGFSAVWR